MPTYEYHCNGCRRDFEVEKRMSDPVDQACTLCGSLDTQRLISHSSFVLKGSGWYVTDYARKNGSGGSSDRGHSSSHGTGNGNGGNGDAASTSGTAAPAQASGPAPAAGGRSATTPPSGSAG